VVGFGGGEGRGDRAVLSQAVRAFGLRRCRSIGLAKTQLQQVLTVIAVNIARVDAWLTERPLAKTRRSAFASLAPPGRSGLGFLRIEFASSIH